MNSIVHKLTRGCDNTLPLLKQRSLKTVAWTKTIDFVSAHQLLHWLQDHTQLQAQT